jgi:hypothetical protein
MKKTLLLLGLVLLPVAVFAQGTVNFANTTVTRMTTNSTTSTSGGPYTPPGQAPNSTGNTAPAGQYVVGFYQAPQGTTDPAAFSLVTPTTPNAPVGGLFNGNPAGGFFAIPGNTGQAIAFQIRAWQIAGGSSYEAATAVNLYRGISAIGEVIPATGVVLTPNLFGTGAGQIGGFVLTPNPNPIPEPSSIALGLLGLGAIALFRRRK